jgi:acetyltransferase-like isoleucine patch superfamily enzyme
VLARVLHRARQIVMPSIGRIYFAAHGISVGSNLKLSSLPTCYRHARATLTLGEHVSIANSTLDNFAGVAMRSVLVANRPGAVLSIGDHVGMSGVAIFCSNSITIGNYVNLGVGVRVYDTDFHPLDWQARRTNDSSKITSKPIIIRDDAFIGANAIILKGVTVGARSIIGAGSVVTCDIPDDVVAVGVPAQVIRRLNHSESRAALSKSVR